MGVAWLGGWVAGRHGLHMLPRCCAVAADLEHVLSLPSAHAYPPRCGHKRSKQEKKKKKEEEEPRGRTDEQQQTWNDVRWVVDRSDRQWAEFLRTLTLQFKSVEAKVEAQGAKMEDKIEAQGAKIEAQGKKIERAEITAGVLIAIVVSLNVFFKGGVWVRVLEALLRFARGE